MTVFLTTHYLEEAEACDQVAFLASGKVIGAGTPDALVRKFGRYVLEIDGTDLEAVAGLLSPRLGPCLKEGGTASFRVLDEQFSFADLQGRTQQQRAGGALASAQPQRRVPVDKRPGLERGLRDMTWRPVWALIEREMMRMVRQRGPVGERLGSPAHLAAGDRWRLRRLAGG